MRALHVPRFSVVMILAVAISSYLFARSQADDQTRALVGKSRSEVLERLGVPDSVDGGDNEMFFVYGKKAVIAFHENQVFWIDPEFEGVKSPRPIPEEGAYAGQSLGELLSRWGGPESFSSNTGFPSMGGGLNLAYPNKIVRVARGVVLEVRNRTRAESGEK